MIHTKELSLLRKVLMSEYLLYTEGLISEKEYRIRAKPIDIAIDKLEMATLQDTPVWKESFLQHVLKLTH